MCQPIKGVVLYQSESERYTELEPHHTNKFHFLSLGNYRSKSQSSEKLKNKCINPKFPEPKFSAKSMEFVEVLSDSHWIIIIEPTLLAIQSASPPLKNGELQRRSRAWEEEEEGIRRESESAKKRERNLPVNFGFKSENPQNSIKIRSIPKESVQISIKNSGKPQSSSSSHNRSKKTDRCRSVKELNGSDSYKKPWNPKKYVKTSRLTTN